MAKKAHMNSVAAMLENAQKTMGELLDGDLAVIIDEWTIADFSLCKGPAIKKKIGRRVVLINKAEQIVYIRNFNSCKLNDVCGIYNDIKWNT